MWLRKSMGLNYVAQKKWYCIKGENFINSFLFNKTNSRTNYDQGRAAERPCS
jgi:hypothetical protein